ncbi:GAP family protein [Brevibacterium album]|uniref:GAP family protein n=1 Tax=Brevibacterium album TaxID=417948 RepID=UPI0004258E0C|nr:GAP family protein [Brevibacterium album]
MTSALALSILGLALFDSTSAGTSLVPLWLLLAPGRVRSGRIAAYLVTLAGAYFAGGVLVALIARPVLGFLTGVLEGWSPVTAPLVLAGLGLLTAGMGALMLTRTFAQAARLIPSQLQDWRRRTLEADSARGIMGVALIAFAVEFTGMLPYLGAIALLTGTDLGWAGITGWIGLYCLVMILPAVLLTLVRVLAHERIDPALHRLDAWLERRGTQLSAVSFIAVGALLAAYGGVGLFT